MLDELSEGVEGAAKNAEFVFTGATRGFVIMALPVLFLGVAVALSRLLLKAPSQRIGRGI
tara:strand:+ start:111 stop:290 length:180 start_codon:yes stop_codon:yes gene_type:complete